MGNDIHPAAVYAFVEEAAGHLANISQALPEALDEAASGLGLLREAASSAGFTEIGQVAQLAEEALSRGPWSEPKADAIRAAIDALEAAVMDAIENPLDRVAALPDLRQSFQALSHEAPSVVALPEAAAPEPQAAQSFTELALPEDFDVPLPAPAIRFRPSVQQLPRLEMPAARKAPTDNRKFQAMPPDLLETFLQEGDEILSTANVHLRALEDEASRPARLTEIRRGVHTLKGAAGSVGLTDLSRLAHRMEDLLDEVNDGNRAYSEEIGSLWLWTFDCLADMLSPEPDPPGLPGRIEAAYARYQAVLESGHTAGTSASPELLDSFHEEAEQLLSATAEALRALADGNEPGHADLLGALRRPLHALQGSAAMAGLTTASHLAHRMEDLIEHFSPDGIPLLSEAVEALSGLVFASTPEAAKEADSLLARFDEFLRRPDHAPTLESQSPAEIKPPEAALNKPPEAAENKPPEKVTQYVRVPLERLDELTRLVSELVVNRSTFEQHLSAYSRDLDELHVGIQHLRRVSSRLDSEEVPVNAGLSSSNGTSSSNNRGPRHIGFDALEFDHYTDLHVASRDLAEAAGDITSTSVGLMGKLGDFETYSDRLSRVTRELQDKLTRLRMVPLSTLTSRLDRTVRVTADKSGKSTDLTIHGEQVEIDKQLLEAMAGPLEHLLRNAVDHGIESQEVRRAKGKPERGQIQLHACHEGTQAVLRLTDDGAGMDPEFLRAAAITCGLHSESSAAALSPQELQDLIFQPGFTTARHVSETSGRGVGMDVVKSTIAKLKGTIHAESKPKEGTCFTIRLPLTLAVMRVLLVKAAGETLAVPLAAITYVQRLEPEHIDRPADLAVHLKVQMQGQTVPAAYLSEILNLNGRANPTVKRPPALLVHAGGGELAVIVDELMEARDVVVKPLGNLLGEVPSITGATIMGDGTVVLIVNPVELVRRAAAPASVAPEPRQRSEIAGPLDVFIVDDSASLRKVLAKFATSRGWIPTTAKDGLDALEILQRREKVPDVLLLDIEMPRMDGFELTTVLRSKHEFERLPIVMLTSRAGEKHRTKAFELGATDYLVKPYQEEALAAVIRRVVDARVSR